MLLFNVLATVRWIFASFPSEHTSLPDYKGSWGQRWTDRLLSLHRQRTQKGQLPPLASGERRFLSLSTAHQKRGGFWTAWTDLWISTVRTWSHGCFFCTIRSMNNHQATNQSIKLYLHGTFHTGLCVLHNGINRSWAKKVTILTIKHSSIS